MADEVVLETDRLVLRPWRVADAPVRRELWTERDPRVPPHRRIDAGGRPTVAELEDVIRAEHQEPPDLLAIERKATGDVIGYCGLVDSGRGAPGEPEIAFELLRRVHGRGYATEAANAVLHWARSSGYPRLWATVWDWNVASRRVLAKLGFTETDRVEVDPAHGTTLFATKRLLEPSRPTRRRLELADIGAWLFRCNAANLALDPAAFPAVDSRCAAPSYRLDLIRPGHPVVLWITGAHGATPAPGVWMAGFATGEVRGAENVDGAPGQPQVVLTAMTVLPTPILRADLRADPATASMEVLRQPFGPNPSHLTPTELTALRRRMGGWPGA